jgi:YidC/Oxa1 family membrane protein insertase
MTNPLDALLPIWNPFLVKPIEAALVGLTDLTGSAGIAIIIFTFAVRTLMLPLSIIQIRSQKAMMAMQPQLREIQRRYAGDRARLGQEQMRLYRESGFNPAAGCLPLVLQMPIWFALYSALLNLGSSEQFQSSFLWVSNLAKPVAQLAEEQGGLFSLSALPLYILPVLTAVTQWVVQKMSTMPSADPQQQSMNRMLEFMPFMFAVFAFQVGSGLVLYWVASNVYSFFQQYFTLGWGGLPILGTRTAAVATSESTTTETRPHRSSRPRPRGSGGSSRRRRGR